MLTDVQIINIGIGKIASNRINSITPARTPLEQFVAYGYPHWKRSELTKRRWVFATVDNYNLTLTDQPPPLPAPPSMPDPGFVPNPLNGVTKPYGFTLPNDCLRPVRGAQTEWKQRGRKLWSGYKCLRISYIADVKEDQFDPLFNDVLAWRIAQESVEFVTQSNTKSQKADAGYAEAVMEAAKANSFVIGPEGIQCNDEDFEWVSGHNHDVYQSGPWGTGW